jgi:hypothetical protein
MPDEATLKALQEEFPLWDIRPGLRCAWYALLSDGGSTAEVKAENLDDLRDRMLLVAEHRDLIKGLRDRTSTRRPGFSVAGRRGRGGRCG